MSHFTRLRTTIKDREVLERCLEEMGYDVLEGGRISGFSGRRRVDLRVPVRRGYEIGFKQAQDGTYEVIADWWGVEGTNSGDFSRRLERQFEDIQREVRRQYALETVLEKSREQGFDVVEQQHREDGSIRVVVRRWA
jgi:hypothetical protein